MLASQPTDDLARAADLFRPPAAGQRLQRPNTVAFRVPGLASRAAAPDVLRDVLRSYEPSQVSCLQAVGTNGYLLTLGSQACVLKALENGVKVGDRVIRVDQVSGGLTVVTLTGLPFEVSNDVLRKELSIYGDVKRVDLERYPPELHNIPTGNRKVFVALKKRIPNILTIAGFEVVAWYRDVERMCRRCGKDGHKAAECEQPLVRVKRCDVCGNRWHTASECTGCRTCRAGTHGTADCPLNVTDGSPAATANAPVSVTASVDASASAPAADPLVVAGTASPPTSGLGPDGQKLMDAFVALKDITKSILQSPDAAAKLDAVNTAISETVNASATSSASAAKPKAKGCSNCYQKTHELADCTYSKRDPNAAAVVAAWANGTTDSTASVLADAAKASDATAKVVASATAALKHVSDSASAPPAKKHVSAAAAPTYAGSFGKSKWNAPSKTSSKPKTQSKKKRAKAVDLDDIMPPLCDEDMIFSDADDIPDFEDIRYEDLPPELRHELWMQHSFAYSVGLAKAPPPGSAPP